MSENILAYNPTLGLIESYVGIYKIYILRNPITEEIFYVGQTKMPLEVRLSGHISETGANREKINYIQAILGAGQKPIIEAIETIATTCYIDTMAVNEREIYWIRYHKSLGCNLFNKAATAPDTKCREYHGYLSAIKNGETSWHYYYCGKTAAGYDAERVGLIKELLGGQNMNTEIEKEDVPVLVGELNSPQGINGFEVAQIGHPVFEYKERYCIFLKSLTKTMEQVPDGNGGHKKEFIEYNVRVPYYKKTLQPFITFKID